MADCTAVLCRIRQLPCELRLLIRSYAYFVDFERLEALRQKWAYIENHGLPPLWALLEEPSYLKTRERFVDDAPPNCWPERVEKAFHTAIQKTPLDHPLGLLDLPDIAIHKTPLNHPPTSGRMPRHYFGSISRSQVISDLLLLLTRSIRNKKQCNSHFHEMEKHFPNTRAEMTASKLIESIVSINFTQCSPYSRQHRLLEFLSKKPLEFGSGLSILESFNDILSPTLLSMLGNIHITLNDDNWAHFPWKLFHRETMPGLKTLHLDLAFSSWEKQGWASTLLGDNMQSIAMDIGTDIFLYTKNMSNKDSMEKMLAVKKSWPRWIMTTPDCCLLTTSDRREQINPSLPP